MLIYILVLLYEIVIYFLSKNKFSFLKNKKYQVFVMILPLVLLCVLRSVHLGLTDTEHVYYTYFSDLQYVNLHDYMLYRGSSEYVFFVFVRLVAVIFNNYRVLLALFAIPYFYAVSKHMYDYSNNLLISVVVFIAMYFLYSFYLIKQCIAMGILIFSYKYIVDKKPFKFALLVILATLFHKMSLIFFIAYPFARYKKFNIINYAIIFIVFIATRVLPNTILSFIGAFDYTHTIIDYINYGIYTRGGATSSIFGFLILVVILISSHLFCKNEDNEKDYHWNVDMNMLTLGCVFFAMSPIVVEFYRVSIMFSIVSISRLSYFNLMMPKKYRKLHRYNSLVKVSMVIVFMLYFLFVAINNFNANPYLFMWGD